MMNAAPPNVYSLNAICGVPLLWAQNYVLAARSYKQKYTASQLSATKPIRSCMTRKQQHVKPTMTVLETARHLNHMHLTQFLLSQLFSNNVINLNRNEARKQGFRDWFHTKTAEENFSWMQVSSHARDDLASKQESIYPVSRSFFPTNADRFPPKCLFGYFLRIAGSRWLPTTN